MNPINFKNRINGEIVTCDNIKDVKIIDGIEYFLVRRKNQPRQFLMRKDALVKESVKT